MNEIVTYDTSVAEQELTAENRLEIIEDGIRRKYVEFFFGI